MQLLCLVNFLIPTVEKKITCHFFKIFNFSKRGYPRVNFEPTSKPRADSDPGEKVALLEPIWGALRAKIRKIFKF